MVCFSASITTFIVVIAALGEMLFPVYSGKCEYHKAFHFGQFVVFMLSSKSIFHTVGLQHGVANTFLY